MLLLQLANEIDAYIDTMGLEVDEVQATAIIGGVQLTGEIHEFRQRSADLEGPSVSVSAAGKGKDCGAT